MESFGYAKRDLLVSRVEDARDTQEEAKEQFASALEKFTSVVNFSGGDLEDKYYELERAYERSTADAQAVRDRIDAVESVAEALFKEWQAELDEYTSDSLRRASQKQLSDTRERYEDLMAAMRRAESKIQPVLDAFHDQVLFLKHNLNAKAIASLQDELVSVETDITALVREMQASIDEANAFIESMSATQ
jgi:gas vesicle protein